MDKTWRTERISRYSSEPTLPPSHGDRDGTTLPPSNPPMLPIQFSVSNFNTHFPSPEITHKINPLNILKASTVSFRETSRYVQYLSG